MLTKSQKVEELKVIADIMFAIGSLPEFTTDNQIVVANYFAVPLKTIQKLTEIWKKEQHSIAMLN